MSKKFISNKTHTHTHAHLQCGLTCVYRFNAFTATLYDIGHRAYVYIIISILVCHCFQLNQIGIETKSKACKRTVFDLKAASERGKERKSVKQNEQQKIKQNNENLPVHKSVTFHVTIISTMKLGANARGDMHAALFSNRHTYTGSLSRYEDNINIYRNENDELK